MIDEYVSVTYPIKTRTMFGINECTEDLSVYKDEITFSKFPDPDQIQSRTQEHYGGFVFNYSNNWRFIERKAPWYRAEYQRISNLLKVRCLIMDLIINNKNTAVFFTVNPLITS